MSQGVNRRQLGLQAEEIASGYLERQGYQILERNVRSRLGEMDLIAREGQTLCFVEVRSRGNSRHGFPEESLTHRKRWRLIRLAQGYLKRHRISERPVRFDLVAILFLQGSLPPRVRLIRGAFEV